ncbi:hypothetical protein OICFNHDK_1444 [Methylobacterium bullatum]|uniref:Uncharacterized protein n=1 Tax=Methylobacterium bullatum TaxID=570505 RepID=A0A679JSB0_9HYPH|nr:hypothetical protein OICFNHDK_1444 [Methylobacterium bullatum]CAA2137944.1 hypothetical protein MBLL_00900 [Methylobacterium bullatum]
MEREAGDRAAITCLVGAMSLERSRERAIRRARCIPNESIAPMGDDPLVCMQPLAGRSGRLCR